MWEERFAQEGYLFGTDPVPFLLKHDAFYSAIDSTANRIKEQIILRHEVPGHLTA